LGKYCRKENKKWDINIRKSVWLYARKFDNGVTTECQDFKWALMRKGVPKKYIHLIQDMYEGSSTSVKSLSGVIEDLHVGVDVHQGSAFSLFV